MDSSISLNGIHAAERQLEQAARKITAASTPLPESADAFELTDFASELIAAQQARLAAKANLRVLCVQTDLEHETVNLFA
jgi:hypothetical protein